MIQQFRFLFLSFIYLANLYPPPCGAQNYDPKIKSPKFPWQSQPGIPNDSACGYMLKRTEAGSQRDPCTPMFITALFTLVNSELWFTLDSKCLLTDEWINEMWYMHAEEYYSTLKGQEILTMLQHGSPWGHYAKGNKPITKRQMLYDSPYLGV